VPEAEKAAIESAIGDLKAALGGEDVSDIQAKTQALAQASMKLGEAMYKASQEESAGGGSPDDGGDAGASGSASGEEVVDADFEEIPEDERKRSA
jgi:molecular chaperone DnaK